MDNHTTPLKRCTKCGNEYPRTNEYFHRNSGAKASRDGLKPRCKQCVVEYMRQRRESPEIRKCNAEYMRQRSKIPEVKAANAQREREYRKNNAQRRKEYMTNYRRENRQAIAARKRQYNEENREETARTKRAYNKQNRSQIRQREKIYRDNNPHVIRTIRQRRQARKHELPNNWTTHDWRHCLDYWCHCCAICDTSLADKKHADHWIPLTYKGTDNPGTVPGNMICLCEACNLSKKAKLPEAWLTERYGTDKATEVLRRIQAYFNSL